MPYYIMHSVSFLFLTGLKIFSQGPWKEIQDQLKSSKQPSLQKLVEQSSITQAL